MQNSTLYSSLKTLTVHIRGFGVGRLGTQLKLDTPMRSGSPSQPIVGPIIPLPPRSNFGVLQMFTGHSPFTGLVVGLPYRDNDQRSINAVRENSYKYVK